MQNKGLNKAFGIILTLLSVFDIFINVARFLFIERPGKDVTKELMSVALPNLIFAVLMICVSLYYMLYSYKKPHGNTLKNIFVLFACYLIIPAVASVSANKTLSFLIYFFSAVLIAYTGGRLSKFDKNKKILLLVFVLLVINTVYMAIALKPAAGATILSRIGQWYIINEPIIFAVLCTSYITRFKAHKEAGIVADM